MRGDRGLIRAAIDLVNDQPVANVTQVHAECDLGNVLGHIVGVCSCTGWPAGRDRARAVWNMFFDQEGNSQCLPKTPPRPGTSTGTGSASAG